MALIEVDEDEVRSASAAKQLLDKFSGDPRTRAKLFGMIKDLNPNVAIPELDQPAELNAKLDANVDASIPVPIAIPLSFILFCSPYICIMRVINSITCR